ncbi:MAG: hypothetical protein M3Z05_00530 [Gemmatimonadota bacterium]|nr:hypothetical protein [Gemmatimonadota bacterium]
MVTGHVAVAYAARARWPRAELFALVVATLVPDLADFVLPQGDQCRTTCELYTHAFPAVLVLAAAMAAISWGVWHRRVTAGLAGALVVVHVLCDMLTGYKKFWIGGPDMGLSLYAHAGADFALEAGMMTAAWVILRRTPQAPRWAVHPIALVLLVLVQAAFDAWQHGGWPHGW